MVRIRVDAHIRTIVVVTGGKLTRFDFCIYFIQFNILYQRNYGQVRS
jgi:hypothetical protein